MNRRTFVLASTASPMVDKTAAADSPPWIRPAVLKAGDRVGIVDPSTAVYDPAAAPRITAVVAALGLTPVFSPHLFNRARDYETSRRERLDGLHAMFADPSIKGVFAARGGYGVSEIVADVDYDLIRRNPKVFLGFSDITLLHLAIQRRARLATFHGRMPDVRAFPPFSLSSLKRALMVEGPLGEVRNPPEADPIRPVYPLRTITPGVAQGPLVGGNLAMIASAMGTPWEIDTRGAVLFLEDVDEAAYSIGRMLLQLKNAGKLNAAAAIVFGACVNCEKMSESSPYGLGEQVQNVLGGLGAPVFSGLVLGHTDEQISLPLGVMARVDAGACSLTVTQGAFAPRGRGA